MNTKYIVIVINITLTLPSLHIAQDLYIDTRIKIDCPAI